MRLKHPVFKDTEVEVSEEEAADWLAAGWLEKSQRRRAAVSTDDQNEDSPATAEK